MMRYLFFLFFLLVFLPLNAQKDSSRVYMLITKSQGETEKAAAIKQANEAFTLSKTIGLATQVRAGQNLFQTQLKFNQKYDGLRTFFELNTLLDQNQRWADLIANYQIIGRYYKSQNLYSNAIQQLEKADALALDKNIAIDFWQNTSELAGLFASSLQAQKALQHYQEALELIDDNHPESTKRKIITYRNIAITNYDLENFEGSKDANIKALALMKKDGENEAYANQLNNIGYSYQKMGNSTKALDYFLQTLKGREELGLKDADHIPLLINIGIAYQNLHKNVESVAYLQRAEKASKSNSEKAVINDLMAIAFLANDDVIRAKTKNETSLYLVKLSGDKKVEAEIYLTASLIDEKALAFDDALENYKKYLNLKDSLEDAASLSQQELLQAEYAVERTQGEIQSLISTNQIKDYQIAQLQLEAENRKKEYQIVDAQSKAKLQALQLSQKTLEAEKKQRQLAYLEAQQKNQQLEFERQKLQEEKAIQNLKIAEEQNKIQELELDRRRSANLNLLIILGLLLVLAIIMIYAFIGTRKKNKQLADSRELIKQERDRSDDLLLNILPESTANELKQTGRATPKKFKSATVFFSDFKNFSSLSKSYSPEELIEELEGFFGGFDKIIKKYHIEKIKTIGDAYMCASGIPIESNDHALRMVKAALEMIEFTKTVHAKQIARGKEPWRMRIGINTGPVVAGVIGTNKFIYDVWGDSVNLAARLETAGEPDRINISQHTVDLVKQEIRTMYRGEIEVKNMGAVRMFFVEGLRTISHQLPK